MSLFNALNLGDPGSAAERFPLPPPLLLDTHEIGPREVTAPSLPDEEMVSCLKIWQGTLFGQEPSYLEWDNSPGGNTL